MAPNLSIYKASAGSGKTFILTVEYIVLILENGSDEWKHTLAVTFTNKATAEMKSRIVETLYGIYRRRPECDGYMDKINEKLKAKGSKPMSLDDMAKRAGDALTSILHDYSHFRVETIDSFFQSVLRNMAYELGLNASLAVELNGDEVVSLAVDRVVEKMGTNIDLQNWILAYVKEKLDQGGRWDITGELKKFAACIYKEEYMQRTKEENEKLACSTTVDDFKRNMLGIKDNAKTTLAAEAGNVKELINSTMNGGKDIKNYRWYDNAIDKMGGEDFSYEPSNTIVNAINDPSTMLTKTNQKNDALQTAAIAVSDALKDLYGTFISKRSEVNTADLCMAKLSSMRLLETIEDEAGKINDENNQFVLSRTATLLSQLKGDTDTPFMFEKTGTTLHNVMIDEFQDTSQQQWDNFKELLIENQSTGGTDLLVGDIKQSIYRWRNGKWEILANVKNELKRLSPKEETLEYNYRSEKEIIDFNNMFFPKTAKLLDAMGDKPKGYSSIADVYKDVHQKTSEKKEKNPRGYVSVRLCEKNDDYREKTCSQVVDSIRSLLGSGLRQKDIAILVRKNEYINVLTAYFSAKATGLRLVSDEAFTLEASLAVQMMIAALRCMENTKEKDPIPYRFLALHYTKDIMHQQVDMKDVLSTPEELQTEFFDKRNDLAKLPLYILCERLQHILRLSEMEGQDVYLFTFFDNLQACIRNGTSDIHSFLQAWDQDIHAKTITPTATDGIRIMTIHKSKGLQFHTVLLPFLDWETDKTRNDDTVWYRPKSNPFNELGALPMALGKKMENSTMKDVFLNEKFQKRVDALNMLYVAFTRPECNLMIWASIKPDSKKDKDDKKETETTEETKAQVSLTTMGELAKAVLGDSLKEDGEWFSYNTGTPVTPSADKDKTKDKKEENENRMKTENTDKNAVEVKMVSSDPRLDFKQSNLARRYLAELAGADMAKRENSIETGIALHYVLSQIRHDDQDQLAKALNQCMAEGLIPDDTAKQKIGDMLAKGFECPTVKEWFSPDREVFNECSIACKDKSCRPDRVVVHGSEVEVVDYKFGKYMKEHEDQVRSYMELLKEIYPGHTVKGFLWYVFNGTVKEVKA